MTAEDVSGSFPLPTFPMRSIPSSSSKPDTINYLELLYTIPFLAANASWEALKAGMPFGGTLGATLMVVMSNDSGDFPFAPFVAAALAFPVAIICDLFFLTPTLIVRYLASKKESVD